MRTIFRFLSYLVLHFVMTKKCDVFGKNRPSEAAGLYFLHQFFIFMVTCTILSQTKCTWPHVPTIFTICCKNPLKWVQYAKSQWPKNVTLLLKIHLKNSFKCIYEGNDENICLKINFTSQNVMKKSIAHKMVYNLWINTFKMNA